MCKYTINLSYFCCFDSRIRSALFCCLSGVGGGCLKGSCAGKLCVGKMSSRVSDFKNFQVENLLAKNDLVGLENKLFSEMSISLFPVIKSCDTNGFVRFLVGIFFL